MAVDLNLAIPAWTDGVDHWRQIDVSWLRDRSILRLADRTVLGASSANAGQTIFSTVDQGLYFSSFTGSGYAWKGVLGSSKLVVDDSAADPQLRLSAGGASSGITWKSNSTIAVTNLQVSGLATINGALSAESLTSNTTISSGGNLTVGGSGTIAGNLSVTGTITAAGITGSSTTAARLSTARSIGLSGDASGAVLFDGSTNVVIPVTIANKSTASTANTLVLRDASGNFAAGAITAQSLNIIGVTGISTGQLTSSIINVGTLNVTSVVSQFVTGFQAQMNKTNVGSDWTTAHFVANGQNTAAAISLHASPFAAQIRLGTAANDLYFRNFNDSGYINLNAAAFVVGSSIRYKDDIKPLDIDAVAIVKQLDPVSWRYKSDPRTSIGFTAERMQEVFPIAVHSDVEGRPDAINSNAIDTLSLVAIQQLIERMEAAEAKLSNMSGVASQAGS